MIVNVSKGWGFLAPGTYQIKNHTKPRGIAFYKTGFPVVMPAEVLSFEQYQRMLAAGAITTLPGLEPLDLSGQEIKVGDGFVLRYRGDTIVEVRK